MASKAKGKGQLLLQSSAHADSIAAIWDNDAVDSLPYVDGALPDGWKDVANQLVAEEMRRMPTSLADYVQKLAPTPPLAFKNAPLLHKQYEAHKLGQKVPPPDSSCYRLDPPPEAQQNDPAAWQKAIDNAKAQLEHQGLRILNMELLIKHGGNAWLAHNRSVEAAIKLAQKHNGELRRDIEELNKTRKMQQTAAGAEIARLDRDWFALVEKNKEIEAACQAIEAQITALGGEIPEAARALGGGQGAEGMDVEMAG